MPDFHDGNLVERQFRELAAAHTGFKLTNHEDGSFLISGNFRLDAEYNDITIVDTFALEISVPRDFPAQIPIVMETGGRIPRGADSHVNPDGSLCLNVPLELRKMFYESGTLLEFVNKSVVEFLYGFAYREKHGKLPYGEWSHYGEGLLEYYKELFNVEEDVLVVGLLRILVDNDFQRQMLCPCGSKKKLRRCHGVQLREVIQYQPTSQFMYDYMEVFRHIVGEKQIIPKDFFSRILQRKSEGNQNGS